VILSIFVFFALTRFLHRVAFCLKYIFLAGRIIRTARRVVIKLPKEYPDQEVYEYSLA
jgi:hypothetical protein